MARSILVTVFREITPFHPYTSLRKAVKSTQFRIAKCPKLVGIYRAGLYQFARTLLGSEGLFQEGIWQSPTQVDTASQPETASQSSNSPPRKRAVT